MRLRRLTADIHGLLVTGDATVTTDRAAGAGIWKVLPKPLDAATLITLVGDLMERSR